MMRIPVAEQAMVTVDACIESIVQGGPIPDGITRLGPDGLRAAYDYTLTRMDGIWPSSQGSGDMTAFEQDARTLRAMGVASCVIAQNINAERGNMPNNLGLRPADEVYLTMRTQRPDAVARNIGRFDFFGLLYRREVEALTTA